MVGNTQALPVPGEKNRSPSLPPLTGSELSPAFIDSFGSRNILGMADAFGETFLYYSNRNPATNRWQRKVTFVKRGTAFGVPVLIGAGYYRDQGR